jgi:hypothetical protein
MVCEYGRRRQCPIMGFIINSVETSGCVSQYRFIGYKFFCNERDTLKSRRLTYHLASTASVRFPERSGGSFTSLWRPSWATVSPDDDWLKASSRVEVKKVGIFSHSGDTKRSDKVTSAVGYILCSNYVNSLCGVMFFFIFHL